MYLYISDIFLLIFIKKIIFIIFISFFSWSIKFPQQIINLSDTGIGDKNLSVELFFKKLITPNTHYLLCESPMYLRWEYFH